MKGVVGGVGLSVNLCGINCIGWDSGLIEFLGLYMYGFGCLGVNGFSGVLWCEMVENLLVNGIWFGYVVVNVLLWIC